MEDSEGSREIKEIPGFFEIISKTSSKTVPGSARSLIFAKWFCGMSNSGLDRRKC